MAGFVKIYGSKLITSSLWDESPEARLVFLSLLAIADAGGYVDVPNEKALARVLNLEPNYIEKGLSVLMAPDIGSRTESHEGRRVLREGSGWRCVNYEKYREFRSESQEATRLRVEKHRAKAAVTSNDCNDSPVTGTDVTKVSASASCRGSGSDPDPDPERARSNEGAKERRSARWWLHGFGQQWIAKYGGLAYGGGDSTSKACGSLADQIAAAALGDVLTAEGRAPEMIREFLADESPKVVKARHPFAFFVTAWEGLRVPAKPIAPKAAPESFVARDERLRQEQRERERQKTERDVAAVDAKSAEVRRWVDR